MTNVFSIIMCIYNTEESLLRQAIDSVLAQDFHDYELILVDDGSNEDTARIIDEYHEALIIHQPNAGLIQSRLNGLKSATGQYVIFLDSDDFLMAGALSKINDVITNDDIDIVTFDYARFSDDPHNYSAKNHFLEAGKVSKDNMLKQLCLLHINSVNSKIAKRSLYDGIDEAVNTHIFNGEDLQQSTYLILKAKSFYYIDDIIQLYRLPLGHRSYYDLHKIVRDMAFLETPYKMIFEDSDEHAAFYRYYLEAGSNAIVYTAFRICVMASSAKEKHTLLDELHAMKMTGVFANKKEKVSLFSSALFYLFKKRLYGLLSIAAHLYDLIFKIQRI